MAAEDIKYIESLLEHFAFETRVRKRFALFIVLKL